LCRPIPVRGRGLDTEEDDWFNGSDEEDLSSPQIPWMQQQQRLSNATNLKRKRAPSVIEYPPRRRQFPPSPTPTNSPPSTALVDYEDEDTTTPVDDDAENKKIPIASEEPHPPAEKPKQRASMGTTPSPIKIPVLGPVAEVRVVQSSSPVQDKDPSLKPGLPPTRVEKRQRDEDEDDELLARLAAKSKRASIEEIRSDGPLKQPGLKIAFGKVSEGAKKIKLNLGLGRKAEEAGRTLEQEKSDERG
jgi:hypothetical protein